MEEKLALVKERSKELEQSNAELKERVEYLASTNKEMKDELTKHHEEWDDVFIADPNPDESCKDELRRIIQEKEELIKKLRESKGIGKPDNFSDTKPCPSHVEFTVLASENEKLQMEKEELIKKLQQNQNKDNKEYKYEETIDE